MSNGPTRQVVIDPVSTGGNFKRGGAGIPKKEKVEVEGTTGIGVGLEEAQIETSQLSVDI